MHDAGTVGGLEGAEEAEPHGGGAGGGERAVTLDHIGQRGRRHQLHHHVQAVAVLDHVEHPYRGGVVDAGRSPRLAQYPGP